MSSFLQDVDLYFIMNSHIYNTDDKKIIFILLFLTDGATWTWKELFLIEKAKKDGGYNLGTATTFTTALKDAFYPPMSLGTHEQDSKTSSKQDQQMNMCPNSKS